MGADIVSPQFSNGDLDIMEEAKVEPAGKNEHILPSIPTNAPSRRPSTSTRRKKRPRIAGVEFSKDNTARTCERLGGGILFGDLVAGDEGERDGVGGDRVDKDGVDGDGVVAGSNNVKISQEVIPEREPILPFCIPSTTSMPATPSPITNENGTSRTYFQQAEHNDNDYTQYTDTRAEVEVNYSVDRDYHSVPVPNTAEGCGELENPHTTNGPNAAVQVNHSYPFPNTPDAWPDLEYPHTMNAPSRAPAEPIQDGASMPTNPFPQGATNTYPSPFPLGFDSIFPQIPLYYWDENNFPAWKYCYQQRPLETQFVTEEREYYPSIQLQTHLTTEGFATDIMGSHRYQGAGGNRVGGKGGQSQQQGDVNNRSWYQGQQQASIQQQVHSMPQQNEGGANGGGGFASPPPMMNPGMHHYPTRPQHPEVHQMLPPLQGTHWTSPPPGMQPQFHNPQHQKHSQPAHETSLAAMNGPAVNGAVMNETELHKLRGATPFERFPHSHPIPMHPHQQPFPLLPNVPLPHFIHQARHYQHPPPPAPYIIPPKTPRGVSTRTT